jgi:hypothetical protein
MPNPSTWCVCHCLADSLCPCIPFVARSVSLTICLTLRKLSSVCMRANRASYGTHMVPGRRAIVFSTPASLVACGLGSHVDHMVTGGRATIANRLSHLLRVVLAVTMSMWRAPSRSICLSSASWRRDARAMTGRRVTTSWHSTSENRCRPCH